MKRLAVDIVLFQTSEHTHSTSSLDLKVLLLKRLEEPFKDEWSLIGGAVEEKSILNTLFEKIQTKTGFNQNLLNKLYVEQLCTFDDDDANFLKRDPRNSVVSVAHIGILPQELATPLMQNAQWFSLKIVTIGSMTLIHLTSDNQQIEIVYELNHHTNHQFTHLKGEELAFDHIQILHEAFQRISGKIEYTPLVFQFLPREFTMRHMQSVIQIFTGVIDPHFRRKFGSWVNETEKELRGLANRPAKLYTRKEKSHD